MKTSRGLWIALAALTVAFALPLVRLGRFAFESELYSYLLVIPFISLGLVGMKWKQGEIPVRAGHKVQHDAPRLASLARGLPSNRVLAAGLLALGGAVAIGGFIGGMETAEIFAYVLLVWGICAWFVDRATLVKLIFPIVFLIGLVPIPPQAADALNTGSQHASAAVAATFFSVAGVPVYQPENLVLQLPGISLEVAPQCSGLHSSIALFITSLVAGYLLLRSPWKRAILCLAVVPIALLRNGFRIFVVGELCVRIGPQMINSYVHRSGGWMFFLLSLGLLFGLLVLLARSDRPRAASIPLARTQT